MTSPAPLTVTQLARKYAVALGILWLLLGLALGLLAAGGASTGSLALGCLLCGLVPPAGFWLWERGL